jgi:hypothetical protein
MATKSDGEGVKRRTVLRGLATGFAGAVAAPHASSFAETAPSGSAQSAPSTEPTSPARLLNEQDRETLASLAEMLVPGSGDAGVPDLLDRVAFVETPEEQRALLAAVRAFEGEALATHGSRWVELAPDVQRGILESAASGSRGALSRQLVYLRDAVARTYFATEPGMRKLGWTPKNAWRELPSCDHPGDDHR